MTSTRSVSALDPKARIQRGLSFSAIYPKREDRRCACGCDAPLPKGRRRWASPACCQKAVEHFGVLKGDGTVIRSAVFRRDQGKCADCGLDTEKTRARLWSYAWCWHTKYVWSTDEWNGLLAVREEILNLIAEGFPSPRQTWWNADHIVPVEHGGGGSCIKNFQTLCVACHKIKTRAQAAVRASKRRATPAK